MKRVIKAASRYGSPNSRRRKPKTRKEFIQQEFLRAWNDSLSEISRAFPDFPQLIDATLYSFNVDIQRYEVLIYADMKIPSIPETRVVDETLTSNNLLKLNFSEYVKLSEVDVQEAGFYELFYSYFSGESPNTPAGIRFKYTVDSQYPSFEKLEHYEDIFTEIEAVSDELVQQAETFFSEASYTLPTISVEGDKVNTNFTYTFEVRFPKEYTSVVEYGFGFSKMYDGMYYTFHIADGVGSFEYTPWRPSDEAEDILRRVRALVEFMDDVVARIRERIAYEESIGNNFLDHALDYINQIIISDIEDRYFGYPIYFNVDRYEGRIDVGQTDEYTYGGKPISVSFDLHQFEDAETVDECDTLLRRLRSSIRKKLQRAFAYRAKYYGDEEY